ncbi:MAG: tetratricopeptide repeat protein, partial [Thermodesulfobacteriota bacterium]
MAVGLFIIILNLSLFFLSPVYLFAQTDTLDEIYKEVVELSRKGNVEELIPVFEKMLIVQPSNKKVLMDYSVVLSWAGRCNKSIAIYENLQDEIPAYVLSAAAKCYRDLKQFDKAIEIYKEISQKRPKQSDALIGLAYSYADNLQYSEALETLKPLISSQPESLEPIFAKGYVYERMIEYFKAYQLYEDIIQRYPDNKRAWSAKINVLSSLGAYQPALEIALANQDKV